MDERIKQLSEALFRVFNKFNHNEKKGRKYGVGVLLHPSEIHTIMLIGNNPDQHVSELARIAGITRGAVSQFVAKLEKKGLIKKIDDPSNSLKTIPLLTNKGWVAYWAHEQMHAEMDADLFHYIQQLTDEQVAVIEQFLANMEKVADKRE